MSDDRPPRVRCLHTRISGRQCTHYALPGGWYCERHTTDGDTPPGTPEVVTRCGGWVRLRWPNGTTRTTSAEQARKLGAE